MFADGGGWRKSVVSRDSRLVKRRRVSSLLETFDRIFILKPQRAHLFSRVLVPRASSLLARTRPAPLESYRPPSSSFPITRTRARTSRHSSNVTRPPFTPSTPTHAYVTSKHSRTRAASLVGPRRNTHGAIAHRHRAHRARHDEDAILAPGRRERLDVRVRRHLHALLLRHLHVTASPTGSARGRRNAVSVPTHRAGSSATVDAPTSGERRGTTRSRTRCASDSASRTRAPRRVW